MAGGDGGRKTRAGAPLPAIPDKLYFRIGEVARLLALPAYVLRFWESEFPQLRPAKGGTGQRLYRRRDVEALLEVRQLLYDRGYTIPGARHYLQEHAQPRPTVPSVAATAVVDKAVPLSQSAMAEALQQMRGNLLDLAAMLHRPAPKEPDPAHRGLHVAARRRAAPVREMPSLFAQEAHDPESSED